MDLCISRTGSLISLVLNLDYENQLHLCFSSRQISLGFFGFIPMGMLFFFFTIYSIFLGAGTVSPPRPSLTPQRSQSVAFSVARTKGENKEKQRALMVDLNLSSKQRRRRGQGEKWHCRDLI